METVFEQATVAMSLATVAPDRARELAVTTARLARANRAWPAASVALRALGVALLQLRDLEGSTSAFRDSIAAALKGHSKLLCAEARMSLSATLCVRGLPSRAIREIEVALGDLGGVAAARAMTQRAAILLDMGRLEESLADIRHALPILRHAGDAQWEIRALSNRSLAFIARRAFSAAEDDLLTAQRLCAEGGFELPAAYVEHNLGWLHSSRGEVVDALRHFDAATRAFESLGLEVGSLLGDRAELLLSVRLLGEASAAAEAAVRAHRAQRRLLQVPEALLLLSTVALVQGDVPAAVSNADLALRGYRRLDRPGGAVLARYARVQAMIASDPRSVSPGRARRCAVDLAAAGWTVPALEARVVAGLLALDRGRRVDARADLVMASRARRAGPADARARAWLAEALLRQADGRRSAALSAVSAGLRVVERYQATLGATELRAHVTTHRGSLSALGLRMSLDRADARRVLSFVERGRATALQFRAARPPNDPVLSRDLADLRASVLEIDERRRAGRPTADLTARQVRLEHAVAEHSRLVHADGRRRTTASSITELIGSLDDAALIEYVELDGGLHAVTLVEGRAKLHALGSVQVVRRGLPHLAFALRRLADPRTSGAGRDAAAASAKALADAFDELLLRPLAKQIGDRPLVLIPAAPLQSLPWAVIESCANRPVTVSPSATLWQRATLQSGLRRAGIAVVAGPGLPGADDEAAAVGRIHPEASILMGKDATVSAVSAAMDGAALVHIAAHGRLRSDNPTFSSLLMADGPLTVYDLDLLDRPPHQVVLAACEAAVPHTVATDEVLGLAAALLAQGTSSLVAPVISVMDDATVPLMRNLHAELRAGRTPAEALATAQAKATAEGRAGWAAAAVFICIGAGHTADSAPAEPAGAGLVRQ